ncbi:preprotein translocase subunit SecE [Corynebacterium lipophiloflavum]|uniref:Protein translocase subunit SecE n=1 Tax=Corynebacterium lipophiloflavum (strain ATCC 700352 / DSM 44291 / CCUG 37336 / JCM 10383 / DMMZ 1944) TaxID=525263 RepID=C0XUI6_CORLD|nr:preprotein translocase subunit SecE [Corynebacterium lipophiloflavum]EEI16011.1 preprotein translocase, SecE subunit [Corynebacterium lipophiloflavum DSM 44291]
MTNPQGQNPAQPTSKRQLRGVAPAAPSRETTPAKAEPTDSPGAGVGAFPGEVVSEIRKVIWPTGRQMVNYTLIVFAFLIVLTAIVWSVDWVARWGIEQVLVR